MQATQQAVLHVARQLKASSRAVSEGNALCTVWDTFVSFLKDKGLSPEDDAADWSLNHMHEADGVCEELGGSYWRFSALHVVRRATVLRHLFRPVSDCGGIRAFVREVRRDMELLEAADEQGVLKNAAPAQWVRALTASASFQAGDDVCMAECPRQTPSEQGDSTWDALGLEGAMDETDLDEDRLSRGSVSTSFSSLQTLAILAYDLKRLVCQLNHAVRPIRQRLRPRIRVLCVRMSLFPRRLTMKTMTWLV